MSITNTKAEKEKNEILSRYRALLGALKGELKKGDKERIRLAFEIALDAHKDMRRKSGEPYILHPIAVAQIVAEEIGLGPTGVICALLHDTVEDTEITLEDIERQFGKSVSDIIDGLTKIAVVFDVRGYLQAENIRKILLTMAKDVRVILIKLADRLHNMRTMDSMPRNKQLKITSETVYLYIPLAHRLGLYNIKSELEDLAMKYNEPKAYKQIVAKLAESKKERNKYITEFTHPIKEQLHQYTHGLEIFGRSKTIHSIWRKMKEQGVPFEEVYDKFAIRIIIDVPFEEEKATCWGVYSVVTDIYRPNPDRLRDWISTPKANGYEALHTTVMGPQGKWVEVQIRSKRMNEVAEKGYAAHWKYKEKNSSETLLDDWLKRIRELLENPNTNTLDLIDDFKLNLFSEEIYVFTPKGEMKILPTRSTVLDFAYEIHSELGKHCIGGKLNHKIVAINHTLNNGDQLEILSSKKQRPSEDWLQYVVTSKARAGIKDILKDERRRIIDIGRKSLENIFEEKKLTFNSGNVGKIMEFFKIPSQQELFYSIGVGNFKISDMENFMKVGDEVRVKENAKPAAQNLELIIKNKLQHNANVLVLHEPDQEIDYNLASCCKPIPGDEVFSYVNKSGDIEVHRSNCPKAINNISKFGFPIVQTKWIKHHQIAFLTGVKIKGLDDVGVVYKIATIISGDLKVNMQSITIDSQNGIFEGTIKVFVNDMQQLNELMNRLQELDGILTVNRWEDVNKNEKESGNS